MLKKYDRLLKESCILGQELVDAHSASKIIEIFNECFVDSERTELIAHAPEPEYVPYTERADHVLHAIYFTHDYFASALHEISHWCIAGEARRKVRDYGYWYCPDGRNTEQQALFEQVEVKPQALEWLFAVAANHSFRLSFDNLNGQPGNASLFADNVYTQAMTYLTQGVNERSQRFINALLNEYRDGLRLQESWFHRSMLGFLPT